MAQVSRRLFVAALAGTVLGPALVPGRARAADCPGRERNLRFSFPVAHGAVPWVAAPMPQQRPIRSSP